MSRIGGHGQPQACPQPGAAWLPSRTGPGKGLCPPLRGLRAFPASCPPGWGSVALRTETGSRKMHISTNTWMQLSQYRLEVALPSSCPVRGSTTYPLIAMLLVWLARLLARLKKASAEAAPYGLTGNLSSLRMSGTATPTGKLFVSFVPSIPCCTDLQLIPVKASPRGGA